MWIYWRATVLELDHWSFSSIVLLQNVDDVADAPHFFESSFWKDSDPVSGLGGWGDPLADFSVSDGGFSALHLSYPSPHILRRNFTLRPFDLPAVFFTEPQKEANSTFLASKIESIIESPAGDYRQFQAVFETFEVRAWMSTVVGFLIFM